ncbi:type IV pilus modification protein PilV [Marinobacterium sp. AK62]|uniref:Type IV pilus modification protein PilV n=1 Tax=Marinobacterium alkalitolerans TaxID=1542925 RepID=A0ABS3ZCW7_9GAMM|nr:type IV pilus modification protein PilV [Marinobacterium alkalitolerans]MBP0048869.1 type IV pilus modification protein PilV [Marinobacterium alkalitolerans]
MIIVIRNGVGGSRKMTRNAHKGFTLLESLIALIVFSFALLALAAMYAKTLSMSHSTYLRALASIQAMDMEERIRANPEAGVGDYSSIDCADYSAADITPPENFNGNAGSIAADDAADWCGNNFRVFGGLLVAAGVSGPASSAGSADLEITLQWNERAIEQDTGVSVQSQAFTYTVRK